MIKVGQYNKLAVVKEVPFGVYLDGDDFGEILLPKKSVPQGTVIGDLVEVFIYFDSEDRIIATQQRPKVTVDHCAYLKVIDVNRVGAFLDWGLDKDLLVPIPEQQQPMEIGRSYLVYVKLDYKGRIIASSKLDYCLDRSPMHCKVGDQVNLLIAKKTELGQNVIINGRHWGLVYLDDIFQTLTYGQKMIGYIKTIREDGKVDVTLRQSGAGGVQDLAQQILDALHKAGGFLPLHDKSSPLEIQQAFKESKKSFKNAIGKLYKQGDIQIEPNGIRLRSLVPQANKDKQYDEYE